jgi:hypothetical protein
VESPIATLRTCLLAAACVIAAGPGCALEHYYGVEPEPRSSPPEIDPPREGGGAQSVPALGSDEWCMRRPLQRLELDLPVWDLFVASSNWDALHEDVRADVQVDATVCIDGRGHPIGLELQGSSTRTERKKSFDLKFNRGVPLRKPPFHDASGHGAQDEAFERIIVKAMFKDQSLIREAVAFDLWREMGGEAPRTGFTHLRINGDYWGLYVVVEPVNKAYLRRHGYPRGGQLYKGVRKHGSRADFEPGRDLELAFENKNDENDPRRDDLAALIEKLQRTPLEREAFEREIDPILPLSEYFERKIWVAFTQNGDATAQNFFLYNAPQDGRDRWHQLPWDSDLCFSAYWRDRYGVLEPEQSLLIDGRNHFGRRLIKVDGLREAYIERFVEVMDHVLTPEVVLHHYRRHADRIARDLAVDQERWQRQMNPAAAFDVITDFFERRPAALRAALADMAKGAAERGASRPEDEDDSTEEDGRDEDGRDEDERQNG